MRGPIDAYERTDLAGLGLLIGGALLLLAILLIAALLRRPVFKGAAKRCGLRASWSLLGGWRCWGRIGEVWVEVRQNGLAKFLPVTPVLESMPRAFFPRPGQIPSSPALLALLDEKTRSRFWALIARFNNDGALVLQGKAYRTVERLVEEIQGGCSLLQRVMERVAHSPFSRLEEMVSRDSDPGMRLAALDALLRSGSDHALRAQQRALSDPEPRVRLRAAQGLPVEESVLEALARDPGAPEDVRLRAGTVLSALRKGSGVDPGNLSLAPEGEQGRLSMSPDSGALTLARK